MQVCLFLDLDDTLFQTRPKCPEGGTLRPVAFRRDGMPLSFMTERQVRLFELFSSFATVIPATARNLDAFRRVDLPFRSLAILDFGGVVLLPDGTPDSAWDAQVRPQALAAAGELEALLGMLRRFIAERRLDVNARLIADFDMPLYILMKHACGETAVLRALREECLADLARKRFFVHCNDNNLSVVPRFLGKEHAVEYVLERHFGGGPVLTFGMGDSLTDAGFLRLCDYALLPMGSQLCTHALPPS